jgi:hypothetical protein
MRAHVQMLEFKIGDRVAFQPPGRPFMTGILTRYNKMTVTIITDDGGQWNVSPGFLRKAEVSENDDSADITVIPMKRK